MRARPAVALVLVGVLAGTGAGAVWSAASSGQVSGAVSSYGATAAPGTTDATDAISSRGDDRSSRDGDREVVDGAGAGSILSPNALYAGAASGTLAGGSAGAEGASAPAEASEVSDEPEVPADPLPEGVDEVDFAAGVLSPVVPPDAGGSLVVVPGTSPAPGTGEVLSVRVQVEDGLDVDGAKVADLVLSTLNDPRSWGGDGSRTFARTDAADATFTVTLASPATVDRLCAPLDTGGLWSCGVTGHAVLNYLRWVDGSPNYGDDMASYRQYLVNHEVGHVLGHRHEQCGATADLAPVMVQQSGALIRCVPNGWPSP